ncbi:NPC intracellular cholesterol transporter 1 [Phytophthora boehmeriae]|uniref:NPC intracellular cholesterol transporter 1 n=1 Tax=Phytophthora boehmeriae TaxID=109152 RepID=A0A8T1WTE8_9STRA|nr:NPC intracellular cholesterol transporter 1 [Phytophthora boehmeriae]
MTQRVVVDGRSYELSETLQSAELAPIFADAWTASRVWEASRFLAERLVSFASQEQSPPLFDVSCGQSVLELGSGCGLAGLVAASLGADVLLTDQHEALELLQRNVEANATSEGERSRLHVAEFAWGSHWSLERRRFAYILVSDCINPIYGQESWRNLARSIYGLSDDKTVTYLAHEARGEDEAMTDFLHFSKEILQCQCIDQQGRISLFRMVRHRINRES